MRNMLVAIDFSIHTQRVLDVAGRLGKEFECPVWLVHVESRTSGSPDELSSDDRAEYDENVARLERMAAEFREQGLNAEALTKCGPVVETLVQEVKRLDVDHIVAGTHGYGGLQEMLVGSVSKGLIRSSAIPITLVPRL